MMIENYQNYQIVRLDPETNRQAGALETSPYALSLSGGLGSAIAAEKAIQRYGRENVFLWFADVLKEDEDLYRLLHDLMNRWGGKLYWFTSGLRPEDVWEKKKIIPNNMMAPCSYDLKVKHFRDFIKAMPVLPTVLIGYKREERDRQERTCASYKDAIPDSVVDYPLCWGNDYRDLSVICRDDLGIEPPRVYGMGFDYNNCGTSCCKGGIGSRVLEAIRFPDRFEHDMSWEEKMRAKGGSLEGRSFCARVVDGKKVPLTLREIKEEYVPKVKEYITANPDKVISEKTILRDVRRWQKKVEAQKEFSQEGLW